MTDKTKKIIKILLSIFIPLLIVGVTILIDQLTKNYIMKNFELYDSIEVIPDFFDITYVRNSGSAFSMFADKSWGQTFFKIITPFALLGYVALYYFFGRKYKFLSVGIALTAGGTIGNYIDRLLYSEVIDFLSFEFFGWDFPVFNMADTFLCVGVFMIIIHFLFIDSDAVFKFSKKKEEALDGEQA